MKKVVVLDDEMWALRDIENLLKEIEDFEVVLASINPYIVMDFLQNEIVDVLFTDIKMPGITGLECASFIKEHNLDTLVVIISGYDDYEYMRNSIINGVFDYLLKPVKKDDFYRVLERIREVVDNDEQLHQPYQKKFFDTVLEYVNKNYNKDIKIADVAKANYISERYVAQLFSKYHNMSFLQYVTKLRMEKAKQLLKTTLMTSEEISKIVGYSDGSYFNKVFKKYYDMTPNAMRRNENNE